MNEKFNKFLIYFKPNQESYWRLTLPIKGSYALGKYPISISQRIKEGHYPSRNEKGIPLINGFVHYTTIISFGLGLWELYLDGEEHYKKDIVRIADFIRAAIDPRGRIIQNAYSNHKTGISAMIQGEAISLLCRAYELTGDESYLEGAIKCVEPFKVKTNNGGVVGSIKGKPWYEEYTDEPLNHVLNGKIYAQWGLYDLWITSNLNEVKQLFDMGIDSIENNLNLFDTGYWSRYWYTEEGRAYIASFMYHNLHMCQLKYTGAITDNTTILKYADQFECYAKSFKNRMQAGFSLLKSKTVKKISN